MNALTRSAFSRGGAFGGLQSGDEIRLSEALLHGSAEFLLSAKGDFSLEFYRAFQISFKGTPSHSPAKASSNQLAGL
jgi:hypothetical protein